MTAKLYACLQSDAVECTTGHEGLASLRARALAEYGDSIRASPVGDMSLNLLQIREKHDSGLPGATEEALEELNALMLDLDSWKVKMAPVWGYRTEKAEGPDYYQGRRDVYMNLWTAQFWSNWRTLKILAHRDLLDYHEKLGTLDDSLRTSCTETIQTMADEICVVAPNFVKTARKTSR